VVRESRNQKEGKVKKKLLGLNQRDSDHMLDHHEDSPSLKREEKGGGGPSKKFHKKWNRQDVGGAETSTMGSEFVGRTRIGKGHGSGKWNLLQPRKSLKA